jgi:hydroxylamine reductase (hybrid-cluster protein)
LSLANTIKKNVPNVTNDKSLKELLDSLVDDVLKGAAKGKFIAKGCGKVMRDRRKVTKMY